jgi:hypothetical protein
MSENLPASNARRSSQADDLERYGWHEVIHVVPPLHMLVVYRLLRKVLSRPRVSAAAGA